MPAKTSPIDFVRMLDDEGVQAEVIKLALEGGDPAEIARCFGLVARARGMTMIAKEAGVARETLYKGLTEDGDPRLSTLMGVARALGVTLTTKEATPG